MKTARLFKLKIIILVKLSGVRDSGKLSALGALCFDEIVDKLDRENSALGEISIVLFKTIQRLVERNGKTLKLCLLLVGKVVEVHIIGAPTVCVRVNLVLDTVKTCHKDSRIAEIGVAGSVGVSQLETALVGALCIRGDTDYSTSVGGCITDGYGSLKAWNKALEGVGGGVGDCAESIDVLQER